VASLSDESPWPLMAWTPDDNVARRIRSRDEKREESCDFLVAMEVLARIQKETKKLQSHCLLGYIYIYIHICTLHVKDTNIRSSLWPATIM